MKKKRKGHARATRKSAVAAVAQSKSRAYPDFRAIAHRIFGGKKSRVTGTETVSEQREPY